MLLCKSYVGKRMATTAGRSRLPPQNPVIGHRVIPRRRLHHFDGSLRKNRSDLSLCDRVLLIFELDMFFGFCRRRFNIPDKS